MDGATLHERDEQTAQHADRMTDRRTHEQRPGQGRLVVRQLFGLGDDAAMGVDHALRVGRRARRVGDQRPRSRVSVEWGLEPITGVDQGGDVVLAQQHRWRLVF